MLIGDGGVTMMFVGGESEDGVDAIYGIGLTDSTDVMIGNLYFC